MKDSATLVCSHCNAIVRVPGDRLKDSPRCPTCHQPLVDGKPIALTAQTFDRHLTRTSVPVVVDFWAPWCGPCLAMAPAYQKVSEQLSSRMRFGKLDTEAEPSVAARFNIRSIPTLIVFRDGVEVTRQAGAVDATRLARWLEQF